MIKHQEKVDLSHDLQTLTQYAHTDACYCDTILINTTKKEHLSYALQTLTQYAHTNAYYCDTYPQIGAKLSPRWSINDILHNSPCHSQQHDGDRKDYLCRRVRTDVTVANRRQR